MENPNVHTEQIQIGARQNVTLRPGRLEDAEACGLICYEAFRVIAEKHGFPLDFPSPQEAIDVIARRLAHSGFYGIVAEADCRVIGSNFLDERSTIAGIGPITVDPAAQDAQIGRQLMLAVLDRTMERHCPGARLLQAAHHGRSLGLYTRLGFEVREPIVTVQGPPVTEAIPGYAVRAATDDDLIECNRICFSVHGHDRSGEVIDAIQHGTAQVVEQHGRISGYTTGIAVYGHSVGETNHDLRMLIGSGAAPDRQGFLLPARNGGLFRWCLDRGFRVAQAMTLMTVGLYNEPAGVYLPSVLY